MFSRRQTLALLGMGLAATAQAQASWAYTLAQARGQKVFFNAWGGSERINAYLQWASGVVALRYGVQLQHVKLTDTAEAVKRIRNEKASGKLTGGTVDTVWVNGENFLSLKREGLLFGPFAERLPNYAYVDVQGKPTTRTDFSEPVEGMEAPWGMAQFTLFADQAQVPHPPQSMAALADFARTHPGRISYPRPPAFIGTTFLKQALVELHTGRKATLSALYQVVTPEAFAQATAPLWAYLDALHPHLWRAGKQFPANPGAVRQMLADGELLIALTFNPNEAANEIAAGRLAPTVMAWQFSAGSLANTHFLAIPFNANAHAGAQVLINFLMSPEAQARKADIAQWGDPTVLALDKLPVADRAAFAHKPQAGQVQTVAPAILEPHGSWVEPLEKEWLRRYG